MIYKNIEIHNVAHEILCNEGGVRYLRVPEGAYEKMDSDQGRNRARGSTGVELRFVMIDDEVKIKIQSLSEPNVLTSYQVFFGSIQGGWECHEVDKFITAEPCELVIKKPKNFESLKRIAKEASSEWSPEVVRVIFNRGEYRIIDVLGNVRPPEKSEMPKRTLLTYGSSITHGSNAYATPDTWAFVLANNLNYDLINLGMAGSCAMEPEIIDYIAELGEKGKWDIITLELGINVLDWDEEKIRERAGNAISQIAQRNPDKRIFVISPFYSNDDFNKLGRADKWRRILFSICKEKNYPNVTYFDGKDILGEMTLISADEVHPNIFGIRQIAQRLTDRIKNQA